MPGSCGASNCYPAKRRRVLPRQAPSITPGSTSNSGTSSAQATGSPSNDSGAVSEAASTAPTTSSPAGPTGRQDPGDSSSDGTNPPSGNNTSTGNTSPPSSPPTTTDGTTTTTQPTSQPTTNPPTTEITTTQPTTTTTTTSPTSDPTTSPTSTSSTSQTTTTTPTSTTSSDTTSQSSSDSSQTSSPPTSPPITDSTSLSLTPSQSETPPPSSDTGAFATTITSAISTVVINGTTSTVPVSQIFTQIPTTLSSDNNSASEAATKRNVIAGTVGGFAFIILITALFLFYRRHQTKKVSFFKRFQPKPRTRLLDGEDMDDFDLGAPMARYRDYPVSVASSHAHTRSLTNPSPSPIPGASPLAREFQAASPGPSLMGAPMDPHRAATPSQPPGIPANPNPSPPHLLGMRSESGSIFREAVWPPPGENSNLIDPLRVASAVDLGRIVDDVMGPTASGSGSPSSSSQRAPPPSYRDSRASASTSGRSDLVGDDPFAALTHSREASDAPLLPKSPVPVRPGLIERDDVPKAPGSPMPAPKFGALFVTNMGPLSPSSTITSPTLAQRQALGQVVSSSPMAASAPPVVASSSSGSAGQPRNWLQRSPKKATRPSIDEDNAVDVTDLTSTGHGVGEAL